MKYIRLWMIALAALGGVLVFACGSDSKNDNNSNNQNDATATSSNGNGSGETPSDNTPSGGANDELKNLAGKFAGKPTKVGYDFTTGAAGTNHTGSFTLFWKSKDAYRVDITAEGSTSSFITKDGKLYLCDAGSESCIVSPVASLPLPFLTLFTDPGSFTSLIDTEVNGVSFDKSSETIAGQDATCYKASSSIEGSAGTAEYCFSSDGLLLKLDGGSTGGGTFTLEATDVSGTVADSDLELPYDVVSIPGT